MAAVILIPAYNPDEKLINYVTSLIKYGFDRILIVNDGSKSECDNIFKELGAFSQCTVINHDVNRGKGAALKTGMNYYLKHCSGYDGVVTGDADGQHTMQDTATLAGELKNNPECLLLGSRVFTGDDVPGRSVFGNVLTSKVFKLLYGVKLGDTQTGLRGMPNAVIPTFIELKGDRFEYEMNMLMCCAENGIKIIEYPIKTIYIDENSSSHFNVIKDSVKIYWLMLKNFIAYCASSLSCFLIDQSVYRLIMYLLFPLIAAKASGFGETSQIFAATAIARVCSSLANFVLNKCLVFNKKGETIKSFAKYAAVVVGIMLTSATVVALLSKVFVGISSANIKLVVDTLLAVVSYTVQKRWVFKKEK